ncbi:hypothetical protein ACFWOK_17860 [Streptomyces sindenensis]|uniref:Uncharacterized protein n=1 Tax=Streptomyces sindenensis TaxID=67363 RepID=A0ABW6ESC1_9ACTN|nr:hypothetical protein GCM10010231_66740 [Streptomyces sindenensis]
MADRPVEDIYTALDEQTMVVHGTEAAALTLPGPASRHAAAVLDQRKLLASSIDHLHKSPASVGAQQPLASGGPQPVVRQLLLAVALGLADGGEGSAP